MQLISTLAVFAAAVASVRAQGSAFVYNHCSEQVYLWAVDTERNPSSPTVVAPGGTWSEVYHTPASGGVSVKVSKNSNPGVITQFEYTLTGGAYNMIWYDGSNINCVEGGCPFDDENLYVGSSVASCPQVFCGSSETPCSGFYNTPDENAATHACQPSANVFLHLCLPDAQMPGGGTPPGPPAAPAPAPAAAAAPAPEKAAAPVVSMEALAPRGLAAHAHARRHLHHRV